MKRISILTILACLALATTALGQNLVVNGDFEAGNTGFTTEYTYLDPANTGTWTLGPEYMYTVSTNPNSYHSSWTSFGDHTTGTGKMMIVNGSSDGGDAEVVWAQTVTGLTCVPTYPETTITLYAGQSWDAGDVLVKTSENGVCVKFVLNQEAIADGWVITEAHVAVAAASAGIPQKNGNPIPGQFPINEELDPGVTETEWYCLEYTWTEEEPLVIAAHAKIELGEPGTEGYDSETGWGEGDDFPGRNWATYITYIPEVGCDYGSYLLEFWATSSYPDAPAQLQVEINDEVVGSTLELSGTVGTPGWQEYTAIWDAGTATSALIEIRDLRDVASGDDFVIDDISFVRQ